MSERAAAIQRVLELERRSKARALRSQVGRLADENLTMHQFRTLALLGLDGEMPTTALAEALGAKAPVATGIVQRLVERGFVERADDPNDRRVHLVRLSKQGEEFLSDAFEEMDRVSSERIGALTDAQLAAYAEILEAFVTS